MGQENSSAADRGRTGIERVYAGLMRVIEIIVGTLMVCMVLLVFMNVIFRYFLDFSIAWSTEVSEYLFVWLVLTGSILAFQHGEHLGLDLIPKTLPRKAGLLMVIVADLLVLYAIYLLIVGGWQYSLQSIESGWLSPASGIPLGMMQIMLPISSAILFIQAIIKLVADSRTLVLDFKKGEGAK